MGEWLGTKVASKCAEKPKTSKEKMHRHKSQPINYFLNLA